MLAGWAAAACGLETSDGPMTVGPVRGARYADVAAGRQWLAAVGHGVAGAVCALAARTVLIADGPDGEMAVAFDGTGGAEFAKGSNIANEARDTLTFTGARLSRTGAAVAGGACRAPRCTGAARWRGRR